MEIVQTGRRWKGMRGTEKRNLVIAVITAIVEDLINDPEVVGENFDEAAKQVILAAVSFVPMMIDAAVDFAKTYHDSKGRPKLFCC